MRQAMTIGALAKAAGVNVETVRYYQRLGLLDEPHKPPGGQRRYPAAAVQQLGFIRRAQQLGFSLEEVRSLMQLADGGTCREARLIAEQKLEVLKVRIAQLTQMRRELGRLVERCKKRKRGTACPLIEALEKAD